MTASKSKKTRTLAIEELQPGEGMVELTESEAEAAVGGAMVSGFEVALCDGSVRFHNYKTAGAITPETL